jgi:hypothetical protein
MVQQGRLALVLLGLMVCSNMLPLVSMTGSGDDSPQATLPSAVEVQPASAMQSNFNGTGWTFTGGGWDAAANEVVVHRPDLAWTAPGGAPQFARSAACLFPVPERGELWLVGGIIDPDPTQWNDEMETNLIEVYDIANSTWTVAADPLPNEQSYAGCTRHGDELVMVGGLPLAAGTNTAYSDGMVQRYNLSTDSWSTGTSMPGGKRVGMAGYGVMDGVMYVAGGVNRTGNVKGVNTTLAYDLTNDSWTTLANLTSARIAPSVAGYHGKVYVIGGAFTTPSTWGGLLYNPTNTTEVYDPLSGTWSNHTDIGAFIAASSVHVIHDEIVLLGGVGSGGATQYTYGWLPETGAWRQMGDLGRAASFLASTQYTNHTYAVGGDGRWQVGYAPTPLFGMDRYISPPQHVAVLISPAFDLRTSADGQAFLRWVRLAGQEPSGTDLGLQYRTATQSALLPGATWYPRTGGLPYTFAPGNHSIPKPSFAGAEPTLLELRNLHTWVQFRVEMVTTRSETWTLPTLDDVAWGMDEAVFESAPRTQWQAFGPNLDITTRLDLTVPWTSATLVLDAGFGRTQAVRASEVGGAWQLDGLENDLNMIDLDRSSLSLDGEAPHVMTWNLALGQGAPSLSEATYRLEVRNNSNLVFAAFPADETVLWSDRIEVDLASVTADGRDLLAPGQPVVASNSSVDIELDVRHPVGGSLPTSGHLEARLHLAVEGRSAGSLVPTTAWFNVSGPWTVVNLADPNPLSMVLPSNASGPATVRLEVRSEANISLEQPVDTVDFVLDAQVPTLVATSPANGAYTNLNAARNVVLSFAEVGGFDPDDVTLRVWVEGLDDGSDGSTPDGIASMTEYREATAMWSSTGTLWSVNTTVDDSMNADHQRVLVLVMGNDLAGLPIPSALSDVGHLEWSTRIPRIADVDSVNPSAAGSRLLEPERSLHWIVEVSDGNGLEDLIEVRLDLGADAGLGLRWDVATESCQNLDARTRVGPTCTAAVVEGVLVVEFDLIPTWALVPDGLVQGLVRVHARDADGTSTWSEQGAWVSARTLTFTDVTFTDESGAVTGAMDGQHPISVGEELLLNATLTHSISEALYNGPVRVAWYGQVGPSRWDGGLSTIVDNGALRVAVPSPLAGGLLQAARVEFWDPQDTALLHSFNLPNIPVDEDAPRLIPIDANARWSRYHLDRVQVGVNIEEDNAWTGALTVTCKVASTQQSWPESTVNVVPTGTLRNLVLFTATFDMSSLGDATALDPEATLSCWASGMDDAGRPLVGDTALTALEPWFTTTLSSNGPDLRIGEVTWSGDVHEEGASIDLVIPVAAASEQIEATFVVEAYMMIDGEKVPVVRREIEGLLADEAVIVRGQFNVPASPAVLFVVVDPDDHILELDEEGNTWSIDVGSDTSGMGALFAGLGGGAVLVLALLTVLLRRGRTDEVLEAAVQAEARPSAAGPSRGPPRGPPQHTAPAPAAPTTPPEQVGLGTANAALDALLPRHAPSDAAASPDHAIGTIVGDHTALPGGGDYAYSAEETLYEGPGDVGRWRLLEDGRFERVA